jgi:hypothetical protein
MDLKVAYDFLNFWINKFTGAFYSPEQLDMITDRGQMSLYSDYQPQYGSSERIRDSLSPFKKTFQFTLVTSPGGLVTYPDNMQDALDVETQVMDADGNVIPCECPFLNEDQRTFRRKSQVIPLSTSNPFAETMDTGFQLYPKEPQVGVLSYLKRPAAPVFVYTLVSGRVIVYNQGASTQLEWLDKDQNAVLIKSLSSIGINISEQDIQAYAENKDELNINTKNHI